jgi:hypothetical protein
MLVRVLSASAGGGSDRKHGFCGGGGCHGRRRRARCWGGVPPRPGTQLVYRRGGLPMRPRLTEAGAVSKTSAGALGRGRRGRTGGYSGVRPSMNAGAPRGGSDFEGGLGARNALGRRGASVGARPGRRGSAASVSPQLYRCTLL